MARTKEYKRDEVLEKATALFWLKGFEATSMSELVEVTGLNSASMYKEFGNKEGLFENTLQSYQKKRLEPFIRPLAEEPNMKGIERFLDAIRANATSPDFKGCLMMNTLAEKNTVSATAINRIEKFCIKLKTLLEVAIRGAQRDGAVSRGKTASEFADYIICLIQGMTLYGRINDNKASIASIIDTVKTTLRG